MIDRVFYITLEGITSTVFRSQVYELIRSELSESFKMCLLCFQPVNIRWNKKRISEVLNIKRRKDVKTKVIPYIGFKGFFSLVNAYVLLFFILILNNIRRKRIIIHCRGQESTTIATWLKKINKNIIIISDIRGIPSEEYKEINLSRASYYTKLDNLIFCNYYKKINHFNFVSEQLQNYYVLKNEDILKKCKSSVIPCFSSFCNDFKREENLETLNILYVGGQQYYQRLDLISEVIEKINFSNVQLILCLNGKKNIELEEKLQDFCKKSNIVLKVYYNLSKYDLQKVYSISHIGLLIRDNKILNKVASPVKVSEYFSNGLFVILIGEVGDFYSIIKNNKQLGLAYSDMKSINKIDVDLLNIMNTAEIRKNYSVKFSKKHCIPMYSQVYKEL